MARPRKVPAVLVEATVKGNGKLADLPNDTARLGYIYVVLGDAKLSSPIPGQFTSRGQFREVAGRFARYLEDYVRHGFLEVAPGLCAKCRERWSEMPPRAGVLVVHDWHDHQYDPRKIERQREYDERQRLHSDGVSGGVSDGVSDAQSDAVSDANPTGDSRGRGPDRAPNREPRTMNGSSPHEEDRPLVRSGERADVAALLDAGWSQVTAAQRAVLDEVADRHRRKGDDGSWFAVESMAVAIANGADPLAAVLEADRLWQDGQRRRADVEEAAWSATKAADREAAAGHLEALADRL